MLCGEKKSVWRNFEQHAQERGYVLAEFFLSTNFSNCLTDCGGKGAEQHDNQMIRLPTCKRPRSLVIVPDRRETVCRR